MSSRFHDAPLALDDDDDEDDEDDDEDENQINHEVSQEDESGDNNMNNNTTTTYPLPAWLKFCPGGITCSLPNSFHWYKLSDPRQAAQRELYCNLIQNARTADDRLRKYALYYHHHKQKMDTSSSSSSPPFVMPSLSILAEAAFGRLTGVPPEFVKEWADAMVLAHFDENALSTTTTNTNYQDDAIPESEEDIWNAKPKPALSSTARAGATPTPSLAYVLKERLAAATAQVQAPQQRRPCGYVFARGDIAWNCRTCQTDATCVICDDCFRKSNHDGHEVYFHRTSPGGCCDCGDAEAWKMEGCCDDHRPDPKDVAARDAHYSANADPMEAGRMAARGQVLQQETLLSPPAALPQTATVALATVIGAAVHCLVKAVEGAGIAADPIQFKTQWAQEATLIHQGYAWPEEGYAKENHPEEWPAPDFLKEGQTLPRGYQLHLRLHNDDVHTFDEVIDALHEPRLSFRRGSGQHGDVERAGDPSLVLLREQATEMTHHVDADGQVIVKTYDSLFAAMQGFRRLKTRGLHCAVVSTAQKDLELRARNLASWLTELSSAHPVAAALCVHALVQIDTHYHTLAGYHVWPKACTIPPWAGIIANDRKEDIRDEMTACQRRFEAFPPHLISSFVTRSEAVVLHELGVTHFGDLFLQITGTNSHFYKGEQVNILLQEQYRKSPHALWGTLPALYSDSTLPSDKHPLLKRCALLMASNADPDAAPVSDSSWQSQRNQLTEAVYVVDTDLRKQQEADRITSSVYPHRLPGLYLLSSNNRISDPPQPPNPMEMRHLLAISSFRAPVSSILLLLLMDPYPTKQLRGATHALFLSLLTDSRFKCRFAGAFGVAYRPLSTLFCAGVGTEADTPLHFSVQILTAGSLVRALGNAQATEQLLLSDAPEDVVEPNTNQNTIGVFCLPIAHTITRCIHTNLLGATKEVNMILNNMHTGNDEDDGPPNNANDALLPSLTYVAGEHPLLTLLPAAPDDGFLDSRSTRHKRLPHLLRDLEYVIETPGTAIRLLLFSKFPVYQGPSPLSLRGEDVLVFPTIFARMLRLAQGMDPQKRKISGGHVEYEQNRWLEAFGLSLNIASSRDALAESPAKTDDSGAHLLAFREAMGNFNAALIREVKMWLYREGTLETGLPIPSGGPHGPMDLAQAEALQRSTLHVSGTISGDGMDTGMASNMVALSCATGVKMTENQLGLIENALKAEGEMRNQRLSVLGMPLEGSERFHSSSTPPSAGLVMGDWLRVPHSPLAGDSLSFHLPLHRALAKSVRSICSVVVPDVVRDANPTAWWKIPVLDDDVRPDERNMSAFPPHPLVPLIKSTLRSANCRVVWMLGPDCSPQEAQRRRVRARNVSANIAVTKVVHSLADHPIRCLAAAQQIERHLWARNGSSVAGMAMNYTSTPLCRAFRDLDLLLVQLSASGLSIGLGARRVFALLLSRFNMDGHLCDPERRNQLGTTGPASFMPGTNIWVNPPRLQDPDHAIVLSESFFSTLCVLVTELPPPPPRSATDNSALRQSIRRELLHALASEPRSRSEAMTAAALGVTRREESEGSSLGSGNGGMFRETFAEVLESIGKQKSQGASRASSGPPAFELKAECCDEYDPTFFHLRRQEHQHAMDVVARLRKQKFGKEFSETHCLPLVCPPPKAHPRFLPCRLLLHLPALDAAIRRSLLFALTGGAWLPPPEPTSSETVKPDSQSGGGEDGLLNDVLPHSPGLSMTGDVVVTAFNRRAISGRSISNASTFLKRNSNEAVDHGAPFSKEVVAASAVSFIEVLQLLTLQSHTLEECASLHRTLPDLDEESRLVSSGLSINTYLSRLVFVPDSLVDVWALRPYPQGPLDSKGSGERRGSVLGLLIALYEHRSDHGAAPESEEPQDDGHGGAKTLAANGLKWLLRFVSALVDGATSVGAATKSATTGTPVQAVSKSPAEAGWTIDEGVRMTIRAMLRDLPELWPEKRSKSASGDNSGPKGKEAGKEAQRRVMEMMMLKQRNFAATIAPSETAPEAKLEEECIICRCDDADGENNGPLGYLGHVQRSRVAQMRAVLEAREHSNPLMNTYRVVGHMGCQLRETEALDSKPLTCLPRGSVVTVLKKTFTPEYGILSRRVLVRHSKKEGGTEVLSEGWASVMSSRGYVILSPLISLCYSNSKWGATRPIIKQCGHAAHLKCVETHTLSLHQRAAGDQPYDGRFAANIADGEFLCPLCKQLSNMLIPRDGNFGDATSDNMDIETVPVKQSRVRAIPELFHIPRLTRRKDGDTNDLRMKALEDFGSHLYQAMEVSWDRTTNNRKKQQKWHPAIRRWDYEEEASDDADGGMHLPRLLRQQLISWAAVGHSASAAEAGARGIEEVLPFGTMSTTSDPWGDHDSRSSANHPMLQELKRTISGASGLLEALCVKMTNRLATTEYSDDNLTPTILRCFGDLLAGGSWMVSSASGLESTRDTAVWTEVTALSAALPCHVARDGVLSLRCEARATAASMWAAKGKGGSPATNSTPAMPLAVIRVLSSVSPPLSMPDSWGSNEPCVPFMADQTLRPFHLGIASGYMYVPLLSWDLNTFAGAVFSTMLLHDVHNLPNAMEWLQVARTLLCARIVQTIAIPGGFELPEEDELDDEECWLPEETQIQGMALARLVAHCQTMINSQCLNPNSGLVGSIDGLSGRQLLAGVGRAILPFARSLMLLLRATLVVSRERQDKASVTTIGEVHGPGRILNSVLANKDLMTCEDGFFFVKAFHGPLPSSLIDGSDSWLPLVNRWLVSLVGFELHQGSSGKNLLPVLSGKIQNSDVVETARRLPEPSKPRVDRVLSLRQEEAPDADEVMADVQVPDPNANQGFVVVRRGGPRVELMVDDVVNDDAEEIIDDVDMEDAEEMVDFADALAGGGSTIASQDDLHESSDENSESGSEDGPDHTIEFANVSRSPIIPYQPSFLGKQQIGHGRYGAMFEYGTASSVMLDLSHLSLVHCKNFPIFNLIRLPKSFVELYNIVSKVKGREDSGGPDEHEDVGNTETAICLLTGTVMRSGAPRRAYNRAIRPPGACTLHARKQGSGIGIFFLVQKCTVLLMHNNKSAYSPSIYVDEHGEEDPGLRRGRPLFLNDVRYRSLELLWRSQGIPREVAQIRSTSDRVIRDNWY